MYIGGQGESFFIPCVHEAVILAVSVVIGFIKLT